MKTVYRLLTEPTREELECASRLYVQAGWIESVDRGDFIARALSGSTLAAGAFLDGRLVGLGRALSDGVSDAYVQDVVVDSAFRRRGIGGGLLRFIFAELRRRGVDWIGLVGEPGTEKFYAGLGLRERKGHTLWQYPIETEGME